MTPVTQNQDEETSKIQFKFIFVGCLAFEEWLKLVAFEEKSNPRKLVLVNFYKFPILLELTIYHFRITENKMIIVISISRSKSDGDEILTA